MSILDALDDGNFLSQILGISPAQAQPAPQPAVYRPDPGQPMVPQQMPFSGPTPRPTLVGGGEGPGLPPDVFQDRFQGAPQPKQNDRFQSAPFPPRPDYPPEQGAPALAPPVQQTPMPPPGPPRMAYAPEGQPQRPMPRMMPRPNQDPETNARALIANDPDALPDNGSPGYPSRRLAYNSEQPPQQPQGFPFAMPPQAQPPAQGQNPLGYDINGLASVLGINRQNGRPLMSSIGAGLAKGLEGQPGGLAAFGRGFGGALEGRVKGESEDDATTFKLAEIAQRAKAEGDTNIYRWATQALHQQQLKLAQEKFEEEKRAAKLSEDPEHVAKLARARGDDKLPQGYERLTDGSLRAIKGGPADTDVIGAQAKAKGEGKLAKPLPTSIQKDLGDKSSNYNSLTGLIDGFKEDYAGSVIPGYGDLKNWAARQTGIGNVDSANWWQDYDRFKSAVRHGLFGSALTKSEIESWNKLDINPGTQPNVIKHNLEHQRTLIGNAIKRRADSLAAQGYSKEAIEAEMGRSIEDFGAKPKPPASDAATPAKAPASASPAAAKASGITPAFREQSLQNARNAIASGKSRAAVTEWLQKNGIDPAGLQ